MYVHCNHEKAALWNLNCEAKTLTPFTCKTASYRFKQWGKPSCGMQVNRRHMNSTKVAASKKTPSEGKQSIFQQRKTEQILTKENSKFQQRKTANFNKGKQSKFQQRKKQNKFQQQKTANFNKGKQSKFQQRKTANFNKGKQQISTRETRTNFSTGKQNKFQQR